MVRVGIGEWKLGRIWLDESEVFSENPSRRGKRFQFHSPSTPIEQTKVSIKVRIRCLSRDHSTHPPYHETRQRDGSPTYLDNNSLSPQSSAPVSSLGRLPQTIMISLTPQMVSVLFTMSPIVRRVVSRRKSNSVSFCSEIMAHSD